MGTLSSRKVVKSSASGRKVYGHIQQLTGTSDGQGGLVNGGAWTDVPGLSHVPFNYKTWTPWSQVHAQQIYPGVNTRITIRYRKSAPIKPGMSLVYGSKRLLFRGIDNYDQANETILIYCEENQASGSGH